ncbi:hypothetical protein ASD12_25785 [Mesorhizobium sp. Root102]|uniref:DUF1403 family protein n=1 Tax=Mesorhizobium sp. Root102 TaxID=1736422 RepID=UPI0006FDE377|nr:DUF1403 family protein [Mesorhizobium sp. Root102]KQU92753.1 hypothetical protein ASD12_25785 [Mesorhizobium sp. Root102]
MILRPKPSSRHHGIPAGVAGGAPLASAPSWMRRAVPDAQSLAGQDIEDVAIAAGAVIGALDAVVRQQERWAGAWRQRLALSTAAITAKQAGRVEDGAALRDAVLLTRPGDNVGPAGLLLVAWRRLATRPVEDLLTEDNLAAVLAEFGHRDDESVGDLVDELLQLGASAGTVGMLTGAIAAAERRGLGRTLAPWIADALLAQRLGWAHAVPLLGAEPGWGIGRGGSHRLTLVAATKGVESGQGLAKGLLAAQARAALRAIDLSADLGRRAEKLLAVAPKLRAKGADAIVDRLLSEDAIMASRGDRNIGMSDRGLRRLFDRLVEFGAVRELSGRSTFRIFGL